MSVQNVVLGQLIGRPSYGYELRDRLRSLYSDVLGLSDGAVYAALGALARRGLVAAVEDATRRPDQRVYYEITDDGIRHYREWKATAPRKAPLREELHLQLITATEEDVPALVEATRTFEDECRAQLRQLLERPLDGPAGSAIRGGAFGATLVQDAVVSHLQAMMEWAQRSRRALEGMGDAGPTGAQGRRRP